MSNLGRKCVKNFVFFLCFPNQYIWNMNKWLTKMRRKYKERKKEQIESERYLRNRNDEYWIKGITCGKRGRANRKTKMQCAIRRIYRVPFSVPMYAYSVVLYVLVVRHVVCLLPCLVASRCGCYVTLCVLQHVASSWNWKLPEKSSLFIFECTNKHTCRPHLVNPVKRHARLGGV